jgi:predicted nucleic acid-binding protein
VSVVVSDTTPLNYLILIGKVEVLPRLFGRVLVPPAVIKELKHPKTPLLVATWADNLPSWIEVTSPRTDLHLGIGAGEDEAIALAVEQGNVTILVDDLKARAAARSRGLPTLRTLTILSLADEAGLLDFESAISRLRSTSFYVDDALLENILVAVRARKNRKS